MLDINFIRQNLKEIKEAARKKHVAVDLDKLVVVDDERRSLIKTIDDMRHQQNVVSEEIAKTKDQHKISEMQKLKKELNDLEARLHVVESEFNLLMLQVPQVPHESVPEGESDADNKPVKLWGEIPKFDFPVKDHITLMKELDLVDFERGAKVAGFRGYFLKNEGALLSFALWQFTINHLVKKGFIPLVAPSLVKENSFVGTGWLPQGKEEIYHTQDDLYLAGTAEVPVMGMYQDEILAESELPKKFIAFSPCFRREAGSYGKDTKGIYRLHEFMKVEQVIFCKSDTDESVKWHEEITRNSEEILQALKLPYRVVVNCAGDLGLGQVKKYDIETWIPAQQKYGETHSSSYFYDFQTRRLNIKYRDQNGKLQFAHSLNNTALATPRVLIQLLENYQQKDGTISVPEVLQPYLGSKIISKK
ncbi:MAG: serine--tRNA ligase [bacterium]|nr:serine--tRNA ligase [bacterium]